MKCKTKNLLINANKKNIEAVFNVARAKVLFITAK